MFISHSVCVCAYTQHLFNCQSLTHAIAVKCDRNYLISDFKSVKNLFTKTKTTKKQQNKNKKKNGQQ